MALRRKQRVTMTCGECGSTNVLRDAWASWSVEEQQWELHAEPFDHAHCEDCDGETRIVEVLK